MSLSPPGDDRRPRPDLRAPASDVRWLVERALAEDLTPLGDLSASLLDPTLRCTAEVRPRRDGVLAGTQCVDETFRQLDPELRMAWSRCDGDAVRQGEVVGVAAGPFPSLLTAERTALNFLSHLSGIATATARWVEVAAGRVVVWDTRKTTPGMRSLEKAAVRAGGGSNHRGNLSDWIMLKDNHLAGLGVAAGVAAARSRWPGRTVHVEADDLDTVLEAVAAGADLILLDNFTPDELRQAVIRVDEEVAGNGGRRPLLEASGGITLDRLDAYAATGVDLISSGALTNSAPVLDIGLDITADPARIVA
jgi:nicotinate-nucleotide pyrophosphorylase (carboxylating)